MFYRPFLAAVVFLTIPVSMAYSETERDIVTEAFVPFSVKTGVRKFEYKKGDNCSDKPARLLMGKLKVRKGIGIVSAWIDARFEYEGVNSSDSFRFRIRGICSRIPHKFAGDGILNQEFECIGIDNLHIGRNIRIYLNGEKNSNFCEKFNSISTTVNYSKLVMRKP